MWRWVVRLAGAVVVLLAAIGTVFVVGMRTKAPFVIDTVRRLNRDVTNPRMMRSAGSPGAYAGVIHHTGRTTGRAYETPVGPFPNRDGFVIALPYGPSTDWVRNVLSSGSATLVHQGETFQIDQPEVVPTATVIGDLPASDRRTLRLFDVGQCLQVRRVELGDS